jgi:hypothetical protein
MRIKSQLVAKGGLVVLAEHHVATRTRQIDNLTQLLLFRVFYCSFHVGLALSKHGTIVCLHGIVLN